MADLEYKNLLPELMEDIENFKADYIEKIGKELAEMIVKDIKAQRLDHRPLRRVYKEWKIRHGLDPRILIATARMISKIEYRVTLVGEAVDVGIFGDRRNATLLKIHEYGTKRIPERSTLRAVLSREQKRIIEDFFKGIKKIIDKNSF